MKLRLLAFAAVVAALALFPLGAGPYPVKLLQEILIWGIFAMSLDLLMGYAGMVSFGHSAFFGVGGYVAALALARSPGLVSALVLPAVAAGLAALVIGFFSIRVGGVYFIMLTLAFSQMFHAYTFQVSWLGAEDGLVGIPRPAVPGLALASLDGFHAYLLVLVALAALALWRVVHSPFGHVLRGIHENEARMRAVGYAVDRYKLVAFVIAGVDRGRRRLALHPVQRLDHPGRVLLEDLRRGAADGDHRRHRHPRRGDAGRGRLHPAAEPGQHLHRAVDADPGRDLHPVRALRARRARGRAARARGAPRVTPPLLAVEGLSRAFGALSALNRVSFAVAPRERRAIIGPNGAGKTTLFNVITGELRPTGGRIRLEGAPIEGLGPHAVARRGVARSFQRNNLFPKLAVRENLRLAAAAGTPGPGTARERRAPARPLDRARRGG